VKPGFKPPTLRNTYGLLAGAGGAVLAIGLLLPFVVADPPGDAASTSAAPPVLGRGPVEAAAAEPDAAALAGGATSSTVGTGAASTAAGAAAAPATSASGFALSTPPPAGVALTASDVGVTPETIKVGVLVPDASGLGNDDNEAGVAFGESVGDPGKQWAAFIDELNERGGIGGRLIEPVYRQHNLIDQDDMRAACVYLTEEEKVFAVLSAGGYYGDPILCVTEQHQTPLIAQAGEGDDFYQRSNGLYFSTTPTKDRVLRNLVALAHENGELRGRKIGILDGEGIDAIPVDRTLLPMLARYGYEVTYHARITDDASAAQSQIPIEVQQMRANGVDLILPVTNLIVADLFVQEADAQRYTPAYLLSDFASGATDLYAKAMPASFEGNLAYTALRTGEVAAGLDEAPHDAECREIYERRTATTLDRTNSEYYSTVTACGILEAFARAVAATGPTLTRPALSQSLQGSGAFEVPYSGIGSFGPGKFDAPDVARHVAWHADCRCWLPVDAFRPTPF
jgi:hypothetical protein